MQELKKTSPSRNRRTQRRRKALPVNDDIVQQLLQKYEGINIFFITMIILSLFILVTGVAISQNVASYRSSYADLQKMKETYRLLQIENQKLLIEQQTFSAIPKVASRAVSELSMYYPKVKDKIVLKAQPISAQNNMFTNNTDSNATNSSPSVEGE